MSARAIIDARIMTIVAAVAGGVLALWVVDQGPNPSHLLLLLIGFLLVDAGLRLPLRTLVVRLAVGLALVCGLILVYEWHTLILVGAVVLAVAYLAWTNVREVFR